MTPYEYLPQFAEPMPQWLDRFRPEDGFSASAFFSSRIAYYPGFGNDGHAIKVFGSTHTAHAFVYADYGQTADAIRHELEHPKRGLRGYHTFACMDLTEEQIVPGGWAPHVDRNDFAGDPLQFAHTHGERAFALFVVVERDEELDDLHGPRRLAILFLGADGFATYDALFCRPGRTAPPFAVLLQDHGFGGNYNWFGAGGLLETIARRTEVYPPWMLVGEHTRPWSGYERVEEVEGDRAGMHWIPRFIYRRTA